MCCCETVVTSDQVHIDKVWLDVAALHWFAVDVLGNEG